MKVFLMEVTFGVWRDEVLDNSLLCLSIIIQEEM
jgi:hypothetical protein